MPPPNPPVPCSKPSPSVTVQWILSNILCAIQNFIATFNTFVTGGFTIATCSTDNGPCWETLRGLGEDGEPFESEDQSGAAAAVTNAPTAGYSQVITDLIVSAEDALFLWFTDSVNNDIILSFYVPAGGTINLVTRGELLLPPDAVLEVESSVAGWFSVQALYKEKIVGI